MRKQTNVKATQLKVKDVIKFGGKKYRITALNRRFGNKYSDRVQIHAHNPDDRDYINIQLWAKALLTVYRKK